MLFTRPLVIVLCLGVAVLQATRGNWFEVAGLLGLGGGLTLLRLASTRPVLRWLAWGCFALTAAAMVYVYQRDYR